DAPEQRSDLARGLVVDIADEAQRQMVVLRIDPARARQAAAQHGEHLRDVFGNFETCEYSWHCGGLTTERLQANQRFRLSSCTKRNDDNSGPDPIMAGSSG